MWQVLIGNLAVVALFVTGWNHIQPWLQQRTRDHRRIVFALLMGVGSVSSMFMSVKLQDGVFVDLRASLIATAGFFGGPLAAIIAGGIAAAYRAFMGGQGMVPGLISIGMATSLGIAAHISLRGDRPSPFHILAFSTLVASSVLATFVFLPAGVRETAFASSAPAVGLLNFMATALCGVAIVQTQKQAAEHLLLHTALVHSPDFQYIKNKRSQFVAVNQAVAELHGFAAPDDMHGLSDFDVAPPGHARKLLEAERGLLASGDPLIDVEECVVQADGAKRWFSTSKSRLMDSDGNVLGIAGVTRDVTQRKRLEEAVVHSRNELSSILAEMSDGLAMFDAHGRLAYCNDRYRECFPLTASIRVAGAYLADILRASAESGEQRGVPANDRETWVEVTANALREETEQEIEMFDSRWLRIRTRPTSDGMAMAVVTDITREKEAERVLTAFNDHLKTLAETDGLTGLLNRRAFDENLAGAFDAAARNGTTLGLLLIDVDNFKAYNDRYGHPAGDECLRLVSGALRDQMRPNDIVARYGGEEFAVVLRNTKLADALMIGERLRTAVGKLRIPHAGGMSRFVSISLGVAIVEAGAGTIDGFLARSDAALYRAKAEGRDRLVSWSEEMARKSA